MKLNSSIISQKPKASLLLCHFKLYSRIGFSRKHPLPSIERGSVGRAENGAMGEHWQNDDSFEAEGEDVTPGFIMCFQTMSSVSTVSLRCLSSL